MAISADGYIATRDHNTDWVSDTDWQQFGHYVSQAKCVVMGRKTYEQSGDNFPYDCDCNIVMTSNPTFTSTLPNVLFTNKTPSKVIQLAQSKDYDQLLLIGGGKVNTSFMKENLIDEIILSLHPLILGQGIKLFDNDTLTTSLTLVTIKQLPQLVQLHYRVNK